MSILNLMNVCTFMVVGVFGFCVSFLPILGPIFFAWRIGLRISKRADGMAACYGFAAGTIPASYFLYWNVDAWKMNTHHHSVHAVAWIIFATTAFCMWLGYKEQQRACRRVHAAAATTGFTFTDNVQPNCGRCRGILVGKPGNYRCLRCEGAMAPYFPPDIGM